MRTLDIQLKKMLLKTLAAVLTVLIVITMIVSVSYAWVTLSRAPAATGAQVTISGGRTIFLAPDIVDTVESNGETVTVHYPGAFTDDLVFSRYETYDYLNSLAGITPASTADGINWIIPDYDSATGLIKSQNEFQVDNTLAYANSTDPRRGGHYVYLDFWVVAPGAEYELRVSMDTRTGTGSSLVELPGSVEDETTLSGFALSVPDNSIASIARVGFLVNPDHAPDPDVLAYTRSPDFDNRYHTLSGTYSAPGEQADLFGNDRFTIYEPNGTYHTAPGLDQGSYTITSPLKYDPATHLITQSRVSDILTVQTGSHWSTLNGSRRIDEVFQAGVSGVHDLTGETASDHFYSRYLQWQIAPYITAGQFFTNTETLYANAENGVVSALAVNNTATGGATDSVVITSLQKNVPQRIRMFIWLEGQDADCTASSSAMTDFVLNLELAGASK